MQDTRLARYAWLSIAAAVGTIALKSFAYWLTGSVGLLSDALESLVNLVGAVVALGMLTVAARPPDDEHAYGHSKAEYFSSGVEGTLIIVAAGSIAVTAIDRLLNARAITQVEWGLAASIGASLINFAVARSLMAAAKRHRSITLEADAHHLMTDVWTTVGVIIGVSIAQLTGLTFLDPIVALLVAANIVWTGVQLVRRSLLGLMDTAWPGEDLAQVNKVLDGYRGSEIQFHAIRTRVSGARRFVSMHVLVPDGWTVRRGHDLLEKIEHDIRTVIPGVTVFTHLEPLGDHTSWQDVSLDR